MASSTCATCGNPVDIEEAICPYCDGYDRVAEGRDAVLSVDLGHRRMSAKEATRRLDEQLDEARLRGSQLIRVVTGYGSTGKGGAIRGTVVAYCSRLKGQGAISGFMQGDQLRDGSRRAHEFERRHPKVRDLAEWGNANEGVVIIGL